METQELTTALIDKIISGENVDAQSDFQNIMAQKMTDALDTRKVELAQSIYGRSQETVDGTQEENS